MQIAGLILLRHQFHILQSQIAFVAVTFELRLFLEVLVDDFLKGCVLHIIHDFHPCEQRNAVVRFGYFDHNFGLVCSTARLSVVGGAADITVIHLHDAGKQVLGIPLPHRSANTIHQMPHRFVANAHSSAQLNRSDTSFVNGTQIDRPEPGVQWKMGAVHDRSSGDGGLMTAGTALIGVSVTDGIELQTATFGGGNPIGKAKPEYLSSASRLGVITAAKFLKANLSCMCHNHILPWCSADIIAYLLSNKEDIYKIWWFAELSR